MRESICTLCEISPSTWRAAVSRPWDSARSDQVGILPERCYGRGRSADGLAEGGNIPLALHKGTSAFPVSGCRFGGL